MTSSALTSLRNTVEKLFPWLAYVATATDGGLSLRAAAAKLLHLQGDAGDPAVARVGDVCGRLIWDATAGILYYSPGPTAPYVAVAVNLTTPTPPIPTAPGTAIVIATGSGKVTAA